MEPKHEENALRRALREFPSLATNTVRFIVWLGLWTMGFGAIGLALSWHHKEAATVAITTAAALGGLVAALGLPFCMLWVTAPVVQRNEARVQILEERKEASARLHAERKRFDEMDRSHREAFQGKWDETESLRGQLAEALVPKPLGAVSRMLAVELRDIRATIARAKDEGHYPSIGFHFPAHRWNEHERVVAEHSEIHEIVARAYTAAHQINKKLDARESKRRSANQQPLAVDPGDGLDELHGMAGEALDALGQSHEG